MRACPSSVRPGSKAHMSSIAPITCHGQGSLSPSPQALQASISSHQAPWHGEQGYWTWAFPLEGSSVAKPEMLMILFDGGLVSWQLRPGGGGGSLSLGTASELVLRDLHKWSESVCRPSHPALPPRSSPQWCLRKWWALPWTASNGHISPEVETTQHVQTNKPGRHEVCAL